MVNSSGSLSIESYSCKLPKRNNLRVPFFIVFLDRYCTGIEKKACEALCKLKTDGDEAKQVGDLKVLNVSLCQKDDVLHINGE